MLTTMTLMSVRQHGHQSPANLSFFIALVSCSVWLPAVTSRLISLGIENQDWRTEKHDLPEACFGVSLRFCCGVLELQVYKEQQGYLCPLR